jgi:spermidine dehydrogenase
VREQFTRMFEPYGFDANRDIAGIIANRQGHAYFVGGTRAAQQALAMS